MNRIYYAGQRRNYMQTRDAASIIRFAWSALPCVPLRCNQIRGHPGRAAFQPIIGPSTIPASRADSEPQEMCVPAEFPTLPRTHCLCRGATYRFRKGASRDRVAHPNVRRRRAIIPGARSVLQSFQPIIQPYHIDTDASHGKKRANLNGPNGIPNFENGPHLRADPSLS